MPGGGALSAHGARKIIVKTDGQTKTEKDMYAKLCCVIFVYQMLGSNTHTLLQALYGQSTMTSANSMR
jgi:hypothetical protein